MSIKYQKLKTVIWNTWSDVLRRYMWSIIHMCLLCTSLHILKTAIFNFWYFVLIALSFCYTTVNSNQTLYDF